MTPPIPDKIRSNIIHLAVQNTRYAAGLDAEVQAMVTALGQDLAKNLLGAGLETPRTDWQRARLEALLKEAKATINGAYADMGEYHAGEMAGLVQVSGKGITTAMNKAIGADLMVPPKWTKEQLRTIASNVLIDGAPSATWWSRQAQDLEQDFADAMRKGMLRGETITQLRDRIMGQNIPGVNGVGKIDLRSVPVTDRGVIWAARRNAEALCRTSVITTANAAHEAAYAANDDIMAGVSWCSTLDPKVCLSCAALDGQEWPKGTAHPSPSLHFGCRCQLLGTTKSWEQLAREAHGNSTVAKELDKMPVGNRASMGGPVSGNLQYEDWFADQPEALQKSILGPGKFGVWKRGNLSFADMLDQRGNPLTLKQLEALVN